MLTCWWRLCIAVFLFSLCTGTAFAGDLYFIDANSKADDKMTDLDMMIMQSMDKYGVYRTLLSTNFQLPDEAILRLAKRHPGRIIPTVRLSGGERDFLIKKWDKDVASGQFHGMGEALVYHTEKTSSVHHASEYRLSMNDPLVKASLAQAKKQGWPFTVHIEFGALSREERASYKNELANFLIANRDVAVVLIHLAQFSTEEADPLLAEHSICT
jgi:hypothetical protein